MINSIIYTFNDETEKETFENLNISCRQVIRIPREIHCGCKLFDETSNPISSSPPPYSRYFHPIIGVWGIDFYILEVAESKLTVTF